MHEAARRTHVHVVRTCRANTHRGTSHANRSPARRHIVVSVPTDRLDAGLRHTGTRRTVITSAGSVRVGRPESSRPVEKRHADDEWREGARVATTRSFSRENRSRRRRVSWRRRRVCRTRRCDGLRTSCDPRRQTYATTPARPWRRSGASRGRRAGSPAWVPLVVCKSGRALPLRRGRKSVASTVVGRYPRKTRPSPLARRCRRRVRAGSRGRGSCGFITATGTNRVGLGVRSAFSPEWKSAFSADTRTVSNDSAIL